MRTTDRPPRVCIVANLGGPIYVIANDTVFVEDTGDDDLNDLVAQVAMQPDAHDRGPIV
jgi:hypothetical protein